MQNPEAIEQPKSQHSAPSGAVHRPPTGKLAQPGDLFACLHHLRLEQFTIEHPPFFTMEDGDLWHGKIPGLRCKNLFLKDKRGKIWLALVPGDKRVDLARLEKWGNAPKLSFGRPELLYEVLGLRPGSVTPFGLLNDTNRRVTVIVDEDVKASEWVNFHPLHNAASTVLRSEDLMRFMKVLGYDPIVLDCGFRAPMA